MKTLREERDDRLRTHETDSIVSKPARVISALVGALPEALEGLDEGGARRVCLGGGG